jgi:glycerol-3-phosphate cytidylyltransferase-like family protein
MIKREKIIVVSGEFDSFDYYDLSFLKVCKSLGDWLVVGIHSDMYMEYCQGGMKYPYEARKSLIDSLDCVDEVFRFNDGDGTVCSLLKLVKFCYPMAEITYISDIDMQDMPETKIRGIKFKVLKQE